MDKESSEEYCTRYFVQIDGEEPKEVTKERWVSIERSCGFHNKYGPDSEPATASFGKSYPDGSGVQAWTKREKRA